MKLVVDLVVVVVVAFGSLAAGGAVTLVVVVVPAGGAAARLRRLQPLRLTLASTATATAIFSAKL